MDTKPVRLNTRPVQLDARLVHLFECTRLGHAMARKRKIPADCWTQSPRRHAMKAGPSPHLLQSQLQGQLHAMTGHCWKQKPLQIESKLIQSKKKRQAHCWTRVPIQLDTREAFSIAENKNHYADGCAQGLNKHAKETVGLLKTGGHFETSKRPARERRGREREGKKGQRQT